MSRGRRENDDNDEGCTLCAAPLCFAIIGLVAGATLSEFTIPILAAIGLSQPAAQALSLAAPATAGLFGGCYITAKSAGDTYRHLHDNQSPNV